MNAAAARKLATLPAKRSISDLTFEQIVDEYGRLDAELKLLYDPKVERKKQLAERIRKQADSDHIAANEKATYSGRSYSVILGARKMEREISNRSKLKSFLTRLKVFDKVWKVNLGDIDKHATAEEQKAFIAESQTGPRSIEAVPLVKAEE